ncbi:deoxyribose-phosphate aldolase [Trinickia terrae]|uniref:Deoxyribose-phosphate aldolase n=1 Tax=Trinickia terrae TaxID=2571161 RepID=A0A4U1HZW9_9BURK|nr:deoxyribose-phosphate aldolase [Trinickia terrae]TKC85936.1 deoxyribose-phosphate aldolase [Trinickia terrae]
MTSSRTPDAAALARRVLQLIDLTSLNDGDDEAAIGTLVGSANTPLGRPAALCIYARLIGAARGALAAQGFSLPIATVTNFPSGAPLPDAAARETAEAVALGADEVDVVLPYRALIEGDALIARELVAQCRAAAGRRCLKVILETGELRETHLIRQASEIAIEGGADFIKTSTGKVAVNATLEAAEVMLDTIRQAGRPVGFKAAGGIRTVDDAAAYLALAQRICGEGWATPATFRFGASGLLGNLLASAGHVDGDRPSPSY